MNPWRHYDTKRMILVVAFFFFQGLFFYFIEFWKSSMCIRTILIFKVWGGLVISWEEFPVRVPQHRLMDHHRHSVGLMMDCGIDEWWWLVIVDWLIGDRWIEFKNKFEFGKKDLLQYQCGTDLFTIEMIDQFEFCKEEATEKEQTTNDKRQQGSMIGSGSIHQL